MLEWENLPQSMSLVRVRLKALSSCDSRKKFYLQVFDSDLDALPKKQESLGIQRLIMSETWKLQVCYVKVWEKGHIYEFQYTHFINLLESREVDYKRIHVHVYFANL